MGHEGEEHGGHGQGGGHGHGHEHGGEGHLCGCEHAEEAREAQAGEHGEGAGCDCEHGEGGCCGEEGEGCDCHHAEGGHEGGCCGEGEGCGGDDQAHGHGHSHGGHGHAHGGHGQGGCHCHSPSDEHKREAPAKVATFVVTCSDSRDEAHDETGEVIRTALEWEGHTVTGFRLIKDEPELIRAAVDDAAASGVRALIFNGGTGIGRRDSTVETLRKLFDKELPGFGELFRIMSFQEIGSPAMMSRAVAGTCKGMIVFSVPGSPQAARLAMEELILPELGHAVRELTR